MVRKVLLLLVGFCLVSQGSIFCVVHQKIRVLKHPQACAGNECVLYCAKLKTFCKNHQYECQLIHFLPDLHLDMVVQ